MSHCVCEFNLLWFLYIHFKGFVYKTKSSHLFNNSSNVRNLIYTCSDSHILLNAPALRTNITKSSYAFSFKVTGLNLPKQLHLLIWNRESNLLDALCVKLS